MHPANMSADDWGWACENIRIIVLGDDSLCLVPRLARGGVLWKDSEVQAIIANFGFECRDTKRHVSPATMVFLGCRPYPALKGEEEVAAWGPTVGRRLVRAGMCCDPDESSIGDWLLSFKSMSAWLYHVPILNDLLWQCSSLIEGKPGGHQMDPGWAHKRSMYEEGLRENVRYSAEYLYHVYGLTPEDRRRWQLQVSGIQQLPVIIVSDVAERLIDLDA